MGLLRRRGSMKDKGFQIISLKRLSDLLVIVILIFIAALALVPFIWMAITSLKILPQVLRYPPTIIPRPIAWENYITALGRLPFHIFTRNTIVVALFSVIGSLISCSMVAYAFAKLRFPGRDILFPLVLSTLMLPDIIRLIPTFILFKNFGWINTLLPLIVPRFFGYPIYIFLLRQYFLGIPNDLIDSAKIDGASDWGILWRIILPLSIPVLTVVAIFEFQYAWNDFLWPLVFLKKETIQTLTLGLYSFRSMPMLGTAYNEMMAVSLLATLPMIFLFFAFQRYFLKGISIGGSGIKG